VPDFVEDSPNVFAVDQVPLVHGSRFVPANPGTVTFNSFALAEATDYRPTKQRR
jgi:hypothetical protein